MAVSRAFCDSPHGGELLQFVSCDDRAWHAGTSHYRGRDNCNDDSIGIELEGLEGDTFTPEQYTQLQKLCEDIANNTPLHTSQATNTLPQVANKTLVQGLIGVFCNTNWVGQIHFFRQRAVEKISFALQKNCLTHQLECLPFWRKKHAGLH